MRLIHPLAKRGTEDLAETVPDPASTLVGERRNFAVCKNDDCRTLAMWLDLKLDCADGVVYPRLQEYGVWSSLSRDPWLDLAAEKSEPAPHFVDNRLVHGPWGRGILPPPAHHNVFCGHGPWPVERHGRDPRGCSSGSLLQWTARWLCRWAEPRNAE